MPSPQKIQFKATIEIIGVNPYVLLPQDVLQNLFEAAGKNKGPVPVKGKLNGHPFIQTLVKFSGHWRLYLNTPVRQAADLQVGDVCTVQLQYDPEPRTFSMHPLLEAALKKDKEAQKVFESQSPSRQKEILRYIASLKSEEAVRRNVEKVVRHLRGEGRFAGR